MGVGEESLVFFFFFFEAVLILDAKSLRAWATSQ
jgi:hypothetical protein